MADATLVAGAALIAVLLCLSAFFSASEIAIFSLDRHRAAALSTRSDPAATTLTRLLSNPHRLLVTVLVGNNVVNIAMTSVATVLLSAAFGAGAGVTVATVGMSALVLVFGEITPKSYGVANAESLSLRVARPLAVVGRLLAPLVVLFEAITGVVNRVTGGSRAIESAYLSREELRDLLRTGEATGELAPEEHRIVAGVFDLSTTPVRDIMVRREDVVAVAADTGLPAVIEALSEARATRAPVYEGTLDSVVGVVDVRDAERAAREGGSLDDALRPALRVPASRQVDELLGAMRDAGSPLAVVHDAAGRTVGVVTVDDVVAELVGDVTGPRDRRRIRATEGGVVVEGDVTVAEVNEMLGASLPTDGAFATVAGLVADRLGRAGDVGDAVPVGGATLTVVAVDRGRVSTVRVERSPGADGTDATGRAD